jgi:hypothetical protein
MKCTEKIWVDDLGDGYSGSQTCGGEMEEIGQVATRYLKYRDLYQCKNCKSINLTN